MVGGADFQSCPNIPKIIEVGRSEVKQRRGSVSFFANFNKNGETRISSQLVIALYGRSNESKFATVFGHIIEGYSSCEAISLLYILLISKMELPKTNVSIYSCGVI